MVGQTQRVLRPSADVVGATRLAAIVAGPVPGSQECSNRDRDSVLTTILKLSLRELFGLTTGSWSGCQECSNLSNLSFGIKVCSSLSMSSQHRFPLNSVSNNARLKILQDSSKTFCLHISRLPCRLNRLSGLLDRLRLRVPQDLLSSKSPLRLRLLSVPVEESEEEEHEDGGHED